MVFFVIAASEKDQNGPKAEAEVAAKI